VLGAVGAAAAVAGALFGAFGVQRATGAADLLRLTLPDLDGRPTALKSWQGSVMVVNFWATWCAPCLEEMPLLAAAQQNFARRGLQTVGIALDQGEKIRDFAMKVRVSYPLLVAGSEVIGLMKQLGNPSGALPFTVILDRTGALAYRKLGAFKGAELEGAVDSLLR